MSVDLRQVQAELAKTTIGFDEWLQKIRQKNYAYTNTAWYRALKPLCEPRSELDALLAEAASEPAPAPTPGGAAWAGWTLADPWTPATQPARHFIWNTDGSVTLALHPDSPLLGNDRQLLSVYQYPDPALTADGADSWWRFKITFPADFKATTGRLNWLGEWHTANGQYSCGFGVQTDYPVDYNKVGTNPRWYFRPTGPAGEQNIDGPAVTFGRSYDVLVHVHWGSSSSRAPVFEVWVEGGLACQSTIPNRYVGDTLSFGVYHYRLKVPWAASVTFGKPLMGATRASVGA